MGNLLALAGAITLAAYHVIGRGLRHALPLSAYVLGGDERLGADDLRRAERLELISFVGTGFEAFVDRRNDGRTKTGVERSKPVHTCRSTSAFLISAIAFAGLRCFGQALAQFMMVWQR